MRSLDTNPIIELEAAPDAPERNPDRRPRIPEPPPVRLVAVADVRLPAAAGLEPALDAFYIETLGFEREPEDLGLIYRAENFRIVFDVLEPPIARDDMRPLGIEVPSLADAQRALVDAEVEYTRMKALYPGGEILLLQDPAGNWLEIGAARLVR